MDPSSEPGSDRPANFSGPYAAWPAGSTTRSTSNKWIFFAILLLTSAMISTWMIRVYKADTTVTLAVQFVAWAIAAIGLSTAMRQRQTAIPSAPSRISFYLTLFLIALAVSTIGVWLIGLRSDMNIVFPEVGALIYLSMPFYLLARVARTVSVQRVIFSTCHVILAFSLFSILGDYLGFTNYEATRGRFFGGLGDPVAWALTLPLVVYFATRRFPLAAAAAVGVLLTASRAPTLTVIASILLMLGFARGRRSHYVAMLFLATTLGLYQAGLFQSLASRLSATELLSNDRIVTATIGMKTFFASPLVGNGYYSLARLYPSSVHRMSLGILPAQTSTFVQILSDHGIIAFIPYAGFVISTTIAGIALMRRSTELPDGAVITGVVAWLLAMLWANQSALWLTVGSYIGPLVFGMAGIIAGGRSRLDFARQPMAVLASTRSP